MPGWAACAGLPPFTSYQSPFTSHQSPVTSAPAPIDSPPAAMTTGEFTDFLIAEIEASDGDALWVESLLAKAKAKVLAGGGEIAPLFSGTFNGRNVQRNVRLDATQVASACRAALDYTAADQKGVASSRLDFRFL